MKWNAIAITVAASTLMMGQHAMADIVHLDDVIVTGSECVGFDCVSGEAFGYDTIRLNEQNLQIHFEDSSDPAGTFPTNDWRIRINDSASGGVNYFAIEDATAAGATPFKIEAGAGSNALYVDDAERIGFGTAIPAQQLHIVDGNTPTLRLDQDGSSGFTPQAWDLASNESNFFIRDATNGSKLPFRIRPGAPTSSIDIAADGNVGIGTDSPERALEVERTGTVVSQVTSSDGGAVQVRMKTDSANRRFLALDNSGVVKAQIVFADNEIKFTGQKSTDNLYATFDATGLTVNGSISTTASGQVHPDYVFKPDYKLMPIDSLKAFVAENSHLPEIPSAADMAKNGVNLTDMQILLLKKVEELTLYTIRQQDAIDTQQDTIGNQQNTIDKLTGMIARLEDKTD